MIKINLLGDVFVNAGGRRPAEDGAAEVYGKGGADKRSTIIPVAGILLGLSIASLSGIYYAWLAKQVGAARATNAELTAKKLELQKFYAMETQYRNQKAALAKKKEVVVGLRMSQKAPVHVLAALADCLPDDVWFKKFTQKGDSVSLEGQSGSFEAVNQFKNHLMEQNKFFQNVKYPTAVKKGPIVEFSLAFDITPQK